MNYLIGLDIGTSSIKGVLLAADGSAQYTGKELFRYTQPGPKQVEISAQAYLDTCCALLRRLTARLPADGKLCGICAASASGNLLLLDQAGEPLTPIYNWRDNRTTWESEAVLGADFDTEAFYRKVGWPYFGTGFPLATLCWLKCHCPELLAECGKVCMSTEYLFYRLTGCWGISTSAGTPFYLIDQCSADYIPQLLQPFSVEQHQLPPVGKTGMLLGRITEQGTGLCGVPEGTPVYLGTFDHPSAARAAGILKEGQMLLSCGTSWVAFFPVAERNKIVAANMLADPFLSHRSGCWAGMASVAAISGRIETYIRRYVADEGDIFGVFADEARKSQPGAGGLRIDLLSDEPIGEHPRCHIARAIMEATVRLLKEKLDALKALGIEANELIMVGGPSEEPLWAQIIAEMTGISVQICHGAYAGAVGAAMVAGISAGLYADEAEAGRKLKGE